ncbi:MAG: ABC transporter permease [Candidatus Omnitrophica bacterium]|nr:ABC transporter permease [Candidatus Omnitrophota bacterium]
MKNISAIVRKEFLHIIRDSRTLILIILMPLIQLIMYGYGINTDVKHLATALYNEDYSSLSRRLVESFEQSAYFDMKYHVRSFEELRHFIDRGDAKAGLHIPSNFAKDVLAGRQAQLQLIIDGTDSNPANVALNTAQAVVAAFMQKETLVPAQVAPIDFRPRMWYNPDLKTTFFMIPGLVGLLIQFLIPMITASAIVREKERGNIEQLLVTPIKSHELIIGKIIPYICIGMMIALLVISTAHFLFQVPIRGNLFLLFSLTLLFLIVCLGIGLFASTVAQNQQQAAQIVMFFAMPSILLSGFIFPREGMPVIIYQIGNVIPLTHFLKIVRGIVLKGLGIGDLWPQATILFCIAFVILSSSILKFQKRLR